MNRKFPCAIAGCPFGLNPKRIPICPEHWRLVPKQIKAEMRRLYVTGQESNPALFRPDYLVARSDAIRAVNQALDHRASSIPDQQTS